MEDQATESNTILLLGDATNDGLPEQFDDFITCIQETVPTKMFFHVPGNHDITHPQFIGKDANGKIAYLCFCYQFGGWFEQLSNRKDMQDWFAFKSKRKTYGHRRYSHFYFHANARFGHL